MNEREKLKFTAKATLPYFVPLWIYFQFVPQPPLFVDLLVFPGSLVLWHLILRRLDLNSRFRNQEDEQFQVRRVNAVRLIGCFAAYPILVLAMVGPRHVENVEAIPESMRVIAGLGGFVSFLFMIAYFVMEFVAWRRKRRARAAGTA